MNFYDEMLEQLKKRGMFEEQAKEVLEVYMLKDQSMEGRWTDETDGYPPIMKAIVWASLKKDAYEWIEKNCPDAWFKPIFQFSEEELLKKMEEK